MPDDSLDALRAAVFADPELALRLRRVPAGEFPRAVIAAAAERGIVLSEDAVRAAEAAGAIAWATRWTR